MPAFLQAPLACPLGAPAIIPPMRVRYRRQGRVRWQLELRRWHLAAAAVALLLLLVAAAWLVAPFWELSSQLGRGGGRPSRLYGTPTVLGAGEAADLEAVARTLRGLGYSAADSGALLPGDYRRSGDTLAVYLRAFPTVRGWAKPHSLEVQVRGGRVRALRVTGKTVERAQLEPPLISSFYGPDLREKRPVRLEEVPEELVLAVLAAEDARFFEHGGISLVGIARAAIANVRGGEVRQGGSTLTQQLVKNLFLTHERTVSRKSREVVLALLVDLRYGKREILEAYLNEIYLGASGPINLMGVGAASWAYFGKEPSRLTLGEAATLAGIIPAPARYDPVKHADAAKARRDLVLGRLAELGWLDAERIEAARAEPLETHPQTIPRRRAAYFTELAQKEANDRFAVSELADRGYALMSTLSAPDQREAEEAVPWGLEALEKGWEKGREGRKPLQAALVSLHGPSGGIRAYVGGRDFTGSQFDRAGAHRQPGSAFKPVVFAAALRSGAVTPASFVEDAPLVMQVGGRRWAPENSDRRYRGWVTVRQALEDSLNVPTVRVAQRTGLAQIVALARAMGATGDLQPVPSVALGAFEMTPAELAVVYATLANGGVRPPLHALEGVLDAAGVVMPGMPLPPGQRVLEPEVAYVVTSLLQGVLDSGTGGGVRRFGLRDRGIAGKTGTSNDAKDSWFAGYSPDRTTVVWVGYDESLPTRLSGARGALPIWAKFTGEVRPRGGFPEFEEPEGVATRAIDPSTGQLAGEGCPSRANEVFVARFAPREVCERHSGWFGGYYDRGDRDDWRDRDGSTDRRERPRERRRHGGFRGWIDRVLGEGEEEEPEREEEPPPDDPN